MITITEQYIKEYKDKLDKIAKSFDLWCGRSPLVLSFFPNDRLGFIAFSPVRCRCPTRLAVFRASCRGER